MEKRRQKLHEQQMKRREKQEQRLLALEVETSRKREAHKYAILLVEFNFEMTLIFSLLVSCL